MGSLADRAKELSPFLVLSDGETIVVKYIGWKEMVSPFDPKKTLFQYEFEVNGLQKFWKSGNNRIALFFDTLKKGDFVKLTRHGMDRETRYTVEDSIDETGTLTRADKEALEKELAG